jgi:hypothetical protein
MVQSPLLKTGYSSRYHTDGSVVIVVGGCYMVHHGFFGEIDRSLSFLQFSFPLLDFRRVV